ncbi:MAG: hypothetical protein LIO95_04870 [Clostridiales bacterium]|nr:hypothetical protein [Clostridiales bacterium]
MSNENKSRKNKIQESFLDTGTDAVIDWGNDFIKTNTPKALNTVTEKVKELVSSIANKRSKSLTDSIHETIFAGVEIGEQNKEQSFIKAMRVLEYDDEQISLILETSRNFLVTREEVESEMRK